VIQIGLPKLKNTQEELVDGKRKTVTTYTTLALDPSWVRGIVEMQVSPGFYLGMDTGKGSVRNGIFLTAESVTLVAPPPLGLDPQGLVVEDHDDTDVE
jgi:hypothetical protein